MQATLALDAALAAALSFLYAYVGRLIALRRPSTADGQRALVSFRTWWYSLSALTLVAAARELVAAFGIVERAPHALLTYLTLPLLALALWGLADYLIFVHTGSTRWRRATQVAHIAMAAFLFALVVYMHPLGATAEAWSAPMRYETALSGPLTALTLAVILGPILVLSGAYFSLAFRAEDPTARFRIFTVSGAFLFWFGSSAVASALRWNTLELWPLASRAIALVATLIILLAYKPPRAIRDRLERASGRAPLDDEKPPRLDARSANRSP